MIFLFLIYNLFLINDLEKITCDINESLNFKKSTSFPGITNFHSILYEGEIMKFFRYYGIGNGIERKLKDLVKNDYDGLKTLVNLSELTIKSNTSDKIINSNLNISEQKKKRLLFVLTAIRFSF